MNIKDLLMTGIVIAVLSLSAAAQSAGSIKDIEAAIRKLEADQVRYLLDGDVVAMEDQWSKEFTVNNPFNVIQAGRTGPIREGTLTYSKFERTIEKILVRGDTVIVMGNELVVPKTAPKGSSHDTTDPISRRFTNIWMRIGGKWLMFARHANEICRK